MTALQTDHVGMILAASAAVAAPLVGAVAASFGRTVSTLRVVAVTSSATSLLAGVCLAGAWQTGNGRPLTYGHVLEGGQLIFIDGLGSMLVPYASFIATAILLVAPRRMLDAGGVRRALSGLAATLALFVTSHPVALVMLWIATAYPTWRSTRVTPGGRPAARVFAIYMSSALLCMAIGTGMLVADPPWGRFSGVVGTTGGWLVAVAVMIRKGIVPFHSWYPALFTGAPMSTALLATMPQVASYTAVRLLVGHADGVPHELEMLAVCALLTAVYAAALAIRQRELRGFLGAFSMSQSALVLSGLSASQPLELTGAFCVWISSGLAITGIGLVSWTLESRAGDVWLDRFQGRFQDAPALAAFFLLFGMASIGLPGTLSFVSYDLIVAGSLDMHVTAGLMVIASSVLCGIAVMRCWLQVFGGHRDADAPRHAVLGRERIPLTALIAALFSLGMWPGPLVQSLDRAAGQILRVASADFTRAPDVGLHQPGKAHSDANAQEMGRPPHPFTFTSPSPPDS
jgi:NADH-quinone oxidoreductase subunit M